MRNLEKNALAAWRTAWERLYHPKTSLFYDFVSSYDPAHRFDHLPTPAEVVQQIPNACGWGTGMEDSTILADTVLSAACDRFDATQDPAARDDAARIFVGLRLCGTKSKAPGLVLRSISPFDGESYYTETSVDQVTHFVHALWRYDRSPLCTDEARTVMREMVGAVCRRMERYVVAENDFHVCRENGTRGYYDKMWEAWKQNKGELCTTGRLPMVYAVGWKLTGDRHWLGLYRSYARQAVQLARGLEAEIGNFQHCYPLFQHQVSLEVLYDVAEKAELKAEWNRQMTKLGSNLGRYTRQIHGYQTADVSSFDLNWRGKPAIKDFLAAGYAIPEWPEELRREFKILRVVGEALFIKLMAPDALLNDEERESLACALSVDYDKAFGYGMLYPLAAYWRLRANESRKQPSGTVS